MLYFDNRYDSIRTVHSISKIKSQYQHHSYTINIATYYVTSDLRLANHYSKFAISMDTRGIQKLASGEDLETYISEMLKMNDV